MKSLSVMAVTAAALLAFAPTAAAVPANVNFACQGSTPLGPQNFAFAQAAEVTAPATVAPGGALTVVIDPAPNTIPGSVNGYTVRRVQTFALKLPIPANSTYVSASLAGGSNVGTTNISVSGGVATVTASGPINGGAAFELPTVTVNLTAGSSGTIETKLSGTSYSDPGLTFTAVVSSFLGNINVATKCFPDPNPVITTTTIA
ncbi:cyclase [Actinokineospora guangxiensis]|uniref:Cyclase n=1 Tax=Actinokineospora guangxiensis TaxID=1490288 RepID=A0ABW0EM91_9PSEU